VGLLSIFLNCVEQLFSESELPLNSILGNSKGRKITEAIGDVGQKGPAGRGDAVLLLVLPERSRLPKKSAADSSIIAVLLSPHADGWLWGQRADALPSRCPLRV